MLTIKELKEIISHLPEDKEVGGLKLKKGRGYLNLTIFHDFGYDWKFKSFLKNKGYTIDED